MTSMTIQPVKDKPTWAYIWSLIGGVVGFIFAISLIGISPLITIWGLFASIIVFFAALRLNSNPWEHTKWGTLILIFSIIGIGPFLAFIGGILALTYKPEIPTPLISQGETRTSTVFQERVIKEEITKKEIVYKIRCSYCGTTFEETLDRCPHCGARAR